MITCPKCNSTNVSTERRINGDSKCNNCGHSSKTSYFCNPPAHVDNLLLANELIKEMEAQARQLINDSNSYWKKEYISMQKQKDILLENLINFKEQNDKNVPEKKVSTLQEAINVLRHEIRSDEDYKRGWKDNIAMAFKDEAGNHGLNSSKIIHEVANKAADNFLESFLILDGFVK
jgi:transcription initiation factor TFIIIB Brf1 subunit/transcription initiation factor TFIIB